MSYEARDIKDRIAVGDDCFQLEKLNDGRYRLIPAPDSIIEEGTNVDKALLQPIENELERLSKAEVKITVANEVTPDGTDPVSGAAVAAYVDSKVVVVTEDPGAGAAVSYPDGTVVLVYE